MSYCGTCGFALGATARVAAYCPDCDGLFCSLKHLSSHRERGTCPDHADGELVEPLINDLATPPTEEPRDDDLASEPEFGYVSVDTMALIGAATSRPGSMLREVAFDTEDEDPAKLSEFVPRAAYERVVAERNEAQALLAKTDELALSAIRADARAVRELEAELAKAQAEVESHKAGQHCRSLRRLPYLHPDTNQQDRIPRCALTAGGATTHPRSITRASDGQRN